MERTTPIIYVTSTAFLILAGVIVCSFWSSGVETNSTDSAGDTKPFSVSDNSDRTTLWQLWGRGIPTLLNYPFRSTTHSIHYSVKDWISNPPLQRGDLLDIHAVDSNGNWTIVLKHSYLISQTHGDNFIDTVVIRVNWFQKIGLILHRELRIAMSTDVPGLDAR